MALAFHAKLDMPGLLLLLTLFFPAILLIYRFGIFLDVML